MYDFSRKTFLMLYSINWPNFIIWLPLLLEILCNRCIATVCFPGCDVINFENNLIFLIKPFSYITKKSIQKFKYLENENSFLGEIKSIFIIFKGLSVAKNCLRPKSAPLTHSRRKNCLRKRVLFYGLFSDLNVFHRKAIDSFI